jgi:hypothetical protein
MHGERFLSVNETIAALGIARQATLNARIAAGWLYPEMRNGRRFFLESEVMRVAQFDLLPSEAARKLGMSTKELKAWMVCTDHLAWLQMGTTYYFRSKDVAAVKELLTPYMKMSDAAREFAICYDQLNDGVNKGRLQGFSYGYRFTYVLRNEVAKFAGAAKGLKATEVAARLGIDRKQVAQLGVSGFLSYTKTVGGNRRYLEESVAAYKEAHCREG